MKLEIPLNKRWYKVVFYDGIALSMPAAKALKIKNIQSDFFTWENNDYAKRDVRRIVFDPKKTREMLLEEDKQVEKLLDANVPILAAPAAANLARAVLASGLSIKSLDK